jgi:hypothetical protein
MSARRRPLYDGAASGSAGRGQADVMDQIDSTQNETAPQSSRERPLPTRFGRGNRAAELAAREHPPGSRSDTERTAAVEVADDETIFGDRGGL